MSASSAPLHWPAGDTSRIPFAVYTDEQLHQRELERFFYQGHWCYVGLEAEVPNPGDFKRTVVGERSVILSRAAMARCTASRTCARTVACSSAASGMAAA